MRNIILLLLVGVLAIVTAFASHGKTATKVTTHVEAKLGITSDALNAFSGESVKLPDRIATNDVFIYSVNSSPVIGNDSKVASFFKYKDTRQVLTPMQVILIDRITRPRYPIANRNLTSQWLANESLTPCEEARQTEITKIYRHIFIDYITRKNLPVANYNIITNSARTVRT